MFMIVFMLIVTLLYQHNCLKTPLIPTHHMTVSGTLNNPRTLISLHTRVRKSGCSSETLIATTVVSGTLVDPSHTDFTAYAGSQIRVFFTP